jgi:hypothetical protein
MAWFSSNDSIINALSVGQTFRYDWSKNFNPTTAAAAGEFHTLFRGAGNPGADALYDTGTNLVFQPVTDQTTGVSSVPHGGNVQPTYYKNLINISAFTAAATTVPGILILVDVIWFYRVSSVTTVTAQATTNTLSQTATFTADASTEILTYTSFASNPSNILTGTRVQVSSTTTLPAPLVAATNYYTIVTSDGGCKLATTYANAIAGVAIDITSAGTGTHTLSWLLPRYTNGAGVQAIFFNPAATALWAGTPNLSLGYTNSIQVASRATPSTPALPIGKTGASNCLILASGATGAGKYNYQTPLQSSDAGIAEINTITNSTSYVSGSYTVALIKEIARIPLTTLGVAGERDLLNQIPSLPRIYDGAALNFIYGSGTTTPANSAFSGHITTIWN